MKRLKTRGVGKKLTPLIIALALLFITGCGGGGGDSLNFSGTGNSSSTGGGTTGGSPSPTPASFNLTVSFPAGTPGVAMREQPKSSVIADLLKLISSPAWAQTSNVIISVYGPTHNLITTTPGTRVGPGQYSFQISGLAPGNYLFEATVQGSTGGTLLLLVNLPEGSTSGTMDVASTAGALAALADAPGGDYSGIDAQAYNSLAQTDAAFTALKTSIQTAIQNDANWIQPGTQSVVDTTISTQTTVATTAVITIVKFFPADGATGIATSNFPIYLAFSKPLNPNTVPPLYTDWSVETTIPSSGAAVTITPANVAAYGSWSYSDNARTVAGVSIPANNLVFHFTGGTLNANSRQVFKFRFGALPKGASGTTVTTSAAAGTLHTHTFFTGS